MATIRFGVWNMEWMNDLFTDGPAFHPDNKKVRGPNPGNAKGEPTVMHRRESLSGAINDIDVDNLLLAGRMLGTTHEAYSATRVMGTGIGTGQAAGTAAAIALRAKPIFDSLGEAGWARFLLCRDLRSCQASERENVVPQYSSFHGFLAGCPLTDARFGVLSVVDNEWHGGRHVCSSQEKWSLPVSPGGP